MTPLPVNRFNIESAEKQIAKMKRQLGKLEETAGTLFMPIDAHYWQIEHIEHGSPLRDGMHTCVFDSIEPEVLIDEGKASLVYEGDGVPWKTTDPS